MDAQSDWSQAADIWSRKLGRRLLVVWPSDDGVWRWRVESARGVRLDEGEEGDVEAAMAAAERRGRIVMSILGHALKSDGTGMNFEQIEDDIPMAGEIERSGIPRI